MDRPIESETTKIVENSYRATILAFLDEWSVFAERNGVDLTKVIKAIKIRPTHSNMIFPGPGIGGYCLPKDGGLGFWAYKHILGFEDDIFHITTAAIDINDTRSLHVAELTRDALRNMGRYIAGARCSSAAPATGRTWATRGTVARNSWSASSPRWEPSSACTTRIVEHWYEIETPDTYPSSGNSLARFFRNQQDLPRLRVQKDLAAALKGMEAVILAVRHSPYLDLEPDQVVEWAGSEAGRGRLLRHPGRRQDPQVLRAGLRGEGPGPRPHPADQGRGTAGPELTIPPGIPAVALGRPAEARARPHSIAAVIARRRLLPRTLPRPA